LGVVIGPVRRTEQNWSIKETVMTDWVEVIVSRVDGRG